VSNRPKLTPSPRACRQAAAHRHDRQAIEHIVEGLELIH
jgi:hypothetical protein